MDDFNMYGNRQDEYSYLTAESKADVVYYCHGLGLMMNGARTLLAERHPGVTTIEMCPGDKTDGTYGICFRSVFVYRINGKGIHNPTFPHRINVWNNTSRLNSDPDRFSPAIGRKVGPGRYISPHGHGTDDMMTVTTSAESTAITNNGTNTGTVASGQVYADRALTIGERIVLLLPGGSNSGPFVITARPCADPVLVPVAE